MSDDESRRPAEVENPFDAWLAAAPASPQNVCPWCSAPLDPPDVATCPGCGARLQRGDTEEIPGVTVVDHEAAIRVRVARPATGTGLVGWLTGDRDAMDPALPAIPGGAAASAAVGPGGHGREAVLPPDERLRREMARIGREQAEEPDAGDGPDETDGAPDDGEGPEEPPSASGAVSADGPDGPASYAGTDATSAS